MTYSLRRHYYGTSECLDDDLIVDGKDIVFDRYIDAAEYLACHGNGRYVYDKEFGKCRYYILINY